MNEHAQAALHCLHDCGDPMDLTPAGRESYRNLLHGMGERYVHQHWCDGCSEEWECDYDDCDLIVEKECRWCGDCDGDPDMRPPL